MKFSGVVGFAVTQETSPDVWTEVIEELPYKGDVFQFHKHEQSSSDINQQIKPTVEISIVADPYARKNLDTIRYIVWNGCKWCVQTVDVEYPRLKFHLGGIYHEQD